MFESEMLFAYTQMLDVLTTMIFLYLGISEGNPIIRYILSNLDSNQWMMGLWLFKGFGFYLVYLLKDFGKSIKIINVFYLMIVAYNLIAIYSVVVR